MYQDKKFKKEEQLKLIEISPLYNGYKFRVNYKYDKKKNELNIEPRVENSISIDLGFYNLMTIYNPNGKQNIIKEMILSERVVMITGALTGIGRATAITFANGSGFADRLRVAWASLAERWELPGGRQAVDRVLRDDYLRGLARSLEARGWSATSAPPRSLE